MARVVVVVSEHGDDRRLDPPAGVREHLGLLREAVRRQVAGEQDEIHLLADLGERSLEAVSKRLGRMDVACRCDADGCRHSTRDTRRGRSANAETGRNVRLMSSQTERDSTRADRDDEAGGRRVRDAEIEFMLGGGLAAWALGGRPPITTWTSTSGRRTPNARCSRPRGRRHAHRA